MLSPALKFRTRRALGDLRDSARRLWFRLPPVRRRLRRHALEAWTEGTIAFVCFGNICRSPFAARLAAQESGGARRTLSAGYFPEEGRRSPELAVATAGRLGVDLAAHRSRVLSEELVEQADAIFVFDQDNYRTVARTFPAARENLHFIGALAHHGPLFVSDPFGGTPEDYESTYRRITELVACARDSEGPLAP
jgi:protein-tyrosine phosphatase